MARVITIAGAALALAAVRPADLDAQLVARTGCASHEIETLLAAGPDRVALAVLPLMEGEMEVSDLATMIGSDRDAVEAVRALYADLPPVDGVPE